MNVRRIARPCCARDPPPVVPRTGSRLRAKTLDRTGQAIPQYYSACSLGCDEMLNSQLYREAGFAGLMRNSATGPAAGSFIPSPFIPSPRCDLWQNSQLAREACRLRSRT